MLDDLLQESSIAQAFREEGELRMARRMVRVFLEGRFGALQEDLLAAINTADEATLERIGAQASGTSTTLEQIRAQLGLH